MPDAATTAQPPAPARKRGRLWQLEALRGLAALHVLVNHVFNSYLNIKHAWWNFPFRFGQEGVLIFFLLSGFVICYAHGARDSDPGGFKTYLFKRGRRIYPVLTLSLLLAYIVQCVAGNHGAPMDWRTLAGNLCMLQDSPSRPGTFIFPFGDNDPLWSLSYEWWFYMLFYPINRWVPEARQKYLVLGLSAPALVANHFLPNSIFNFLIFFLIWWAGVEMAREFLATGDVTFRRQKTMLALLAIPAVWYAVLVWRWHAAGNEVLVIKFPFMGFRYFAMSMIFIAILFVWKRWQFAGFRQTVGQFERVGSISYALYLLHYPLVKHLRLFAGDSGFMLYADLGLRILLAFLLAWLAEGLLQKWINSATNPWLARSAKN